MQRILVPLVAILLLTLLATGTVFAEKHVNLFLMTHTHGPFNQWITNKIEEYADICPWVNIEYLHVGHHEFAQAYTVRFAGGVGPDILNLYFTDLHDLVAADMLDPAPEEVVADLEENFIPPAWKGMQVNGRIYGYPTEAIMLLPVAHVPLFEQTGLDYPATYTELLQLQRKMTRYENGEMVQTGIQLSSGGLWLMLHWSAIIRGFGGEILDPANSRAIFNSKEGIEATEAYIEFAPLHGVSFWNHNVGLAVTGSYHRPGWRNTYPDIPIKALPALKNEDGEKVGTAYHWGMTVSSQSKRRKEAWDFVRWLNSAQNKLSLLKEVEYPPVTYANIDYFIDDPWLTTFAREFEYGRLLPQMANWAEIQTAIVDEIARAIRGEISAAEALSHAEQKATAIINEVTR